jgi:hypothetical protein
MSVRDMFLSPMRSDLVWVGCPARQFADHASDGLWRRGADACAPSDSAGHAAPCQPGLRTVPKDKGPCHAPPLGTKRSGAGMPSLLTLMQGVQSNAPSTEGENQPELASAGPRARRAGRERRSTVHQMPSQGRDQALLVPHPAPVSLPQGVCFGCYGSGRPALSVGRRYFLIGGHKYSRYACII